MRKVLVANKQHLAGFVQRGKVLVPLANVERWQPDPIWQPAKSGTFAAEVSRALLSVICSKLLLCATQSAHTRCGAVAVVCKQVVVLRPLTYLTVVRDRRLCQVCSTSMWGC